MHLLKPIFEIEREQALGFAARRGFGLFVAQGGAAAGPFGSHIPFKIDTSKPVPITHFHVTAGNRERPCRDDALVGPDWMLPELPGKEPSHPRRCAE